VWEWAARNLAAASARFASPAERIERALAPWSAYVILPAFAFSATGVPFAIDLSAPYAGRLFARVVVRLAAGKPLGLLPASGLGLALRRVFGAWAVSRRRLAGAACLCGVAAMLALLLAERAFTPDEAAVAKLAARAGAAVAGLVGTLILRRRPPRTT